MDLPLAFQDLRDRLELEIGRWRHGRGALDGRKLLVFLLALPVIARREESLADQVRNAHARGRVARPRVGEVRLFRVLTQRELDPLGRAGEEKIVRSAAPTPLENGVLTADRVGRTVQDVGRGRPARQLAVDRDV